jgi:alpha-L-fucosidase 2
MAADVERCPLSLPRVPREALPLGNGNLGAAVWLPGCVEITLNHGEAWVPGKCEKVGTDPQEVFHLFNLGSVASVSVELDPFPFDDEDGFEQSLDLQEGILHLERKGVKLSLHIERNRDALVLRLEGYQGTLSLKLKTWRPEDKLSPGEGKIVHEHRTIASPWGYMNRRVGLAEWPEPDPFMGRSWKTEASLPGGAARAGALHRVMTVGEKVEMTVAVSSPDFAVPKPDRPTWESLWNRSSIELSSSDGSAEKLQRLWRLHLYRIFASVSETQPGKFNGGLFLTEPDNRPWGGANWYQNVRLMFWSLIASGHHELFGAFISLPRRCLPYLRAQTPHLFPGSKGVYIPEAMSFWGWADFADLPNAYRHPFTDYSFATGPEWLWQISRYILASGDEAAITRDFLPVAREVTLFLRSIAQTGADGRFHFSPANSCETYWKVADPLPLLAGLKRVLPLYLKWGAEQEPDAVLAQARELLEKTVPFARGRLVFEKLEEYRVPNLGGTFAGVPTGKDEGGGPACKRIAQVIPNAPGWLPAQVAPGDCTHNWENPSLYAIYPFRFGAPGSPEHADALASFENREQPLPWVGWSQDAVQAARLGLADEACRLALFHAKVNQTLPFGGFVNAGLDAIPNLDSSGVAAAALSEMLLQDHEEGIVLLPATPSAWSGSFRLHSEFGVEVSCRFERGRVREGALRAKRDVSLSFRHPDQRAWKPIELHAGEIVSLL